RNIVQVVVVDPKGPETSLSDPLSSNVNEPGIASSAGVLEFEPGQPREGLICSSGNTECRALGAYNCQREICRSSRSICPRAAQDDSFCIRDRNESGPGNRTSAGQLNVSPSLAEEMALFTADAEQSLGPTVIVAAVACTGRKRKTARRRLVKVVRSLGCGVMDAIVPSP